MYSLANATQIYTKEIDIMGTRTFTNETVKGVYTKEVNGKFGPATSYSALFVEGDTKTYVSLGFKQPRFDKGSVISFMAKENDKGYLSLIGDTLEVHSSQEQPAPSNPTTAPSNNNTAPSKSKGTDWEAKDKRAAIGFAREQAIKTLLAMKEFNAVSSELSSEAFLSELDTLTYRFISQADSYVSGKPAKAQPAKEVVEEVEETEEFDDQIPF